MYRVGTTPESRSPFHRRWCWALGDSLDLRTLNRLAEALLGEHSFEAFAKAGQPERGTHCVVASAAWDGWELGARFTVTADRYLHHMVRYLVGTMVDIARGRRSPDDLPALLDSRPGLETSPPAPPEGLFLARVEYSEHVRTPEPSTTSETRSTASA